MDKNLFALKQKAVRPSTIPEVLELIEVPDEARQLGFLVETLKFKDPYTFYHSKRVASYAAVVCMGLKITPELFLETVLAALVHDLGKVGTPDRVLKKPGRLTQDEFLQMKTHPMYSCELIGRLSMSESMMKAVKHHHERLDGYGYPDKLKGDQIPLGAKVILVADTYDAMTSDRPYRRGCAPSIAFEELRACAGSQFDPEVVDAFVRGMEGFSRDELFIIEDFINTICKS